MHDLCTLQPARLSDAPEIARMSATLIEHGLPHSWKAERVARHIRHRECTVLSARSGPDLVGFAIMQFGDATAHLNLLAVQPHTRRRGLGRQMLQWLHESAIVAGTFTINLELRAGNLDARRFYQAMGYAECGYVRRYYSDTEDAVRMTRSLVTTD
jgi:ribosomal-protein-alanine N-acetyltransferase